MFFLLCTLLSASQHSVRETVLRADPQRWRPAATQSQPTWVGRKPRLIRSSADRASFRTAFRVPPGLRNNRLTKVATSSTRSGKRPRERKRPSLPAYSTQGAGRTILFNCSSLPVGVGYANPCQSATELRLASTRSAKGSFGAGAFAPCDMRGHTRLQASRPSTSTFPLSSMVSRLYLSVHSRALSHCTT